MRGSAIILLLMMASPAFSSPGYTPELAQKYFSEENFDSALVVYESLIVSHPENGSLFFNAGLCAYRLKAYGKAKDLFATSYSLDSMAEALFMQAICFKETGVKDSADYLFSKLDKTEFGVYNTNKNGWRNGLILFISKNWYYMIALLFITVVIIVLVGKSSAYKGR